jgi:hypothetical protein
MPSAEKLPATVRFGVHTCNAYRTTYPEGGATAIYITEVSNDELVATATVNVPEADSRLGIGAVIVKDYSENEGMMAALEEAGIAAETGKTVAIGYTPRAPVLFRPRSAKRTAAA